MQSLLDLFAPDLVHLAGRRRGHRLRRSSTANEKSRREAIKEIAADNAEHVGSFWQAANCYRWTLKEAALFRIGPL